MYRYNTSYIYVYFILYYIILYTVVNINMNNNLINQEGAYDFLFIGSDRNGLETKNRILNYMHNMYKTTTIIDLGYKEKYPDIIKEFKKSIGKMKGHLDYDNKLAIFIGATGIEMAICANKIKPIRASVCNNMNELFTSVAYYNINVLCLGSHLENAELINIIDGYMRLVFNDLQFHRECVNKITKI